MERRGGRHKYSSDSIPSPLPVPSGFGTGTGVENGHRAGSDSGSSLASDTNVFGGAAENDPGLGRTLRPRRATVSALEASVGDGGGRKRTYRTIGRRTGGKVRGMVATFERSASRSEDSDSDDEDGRRRAGRHRSRSNASEESGSSSASSFSTASSGPFPPDVIETKLKVGLH